MALSAENCNIVYFGIALTIPLEELPTFQSKGRISGGFCEARGSWPPTSAQTWSLWHDAEHYNLTIVYTGHVHSPILLCAKAESKSYAGNREANSHIQLHLKDVIGTIKTSQNPSSLLPLAEIRTTSTLHLEGVGGSIHSSLNTKSWLTGPKF